MKPIILPANQPRDRFYAGGAGIAAFRKVSSAVPNTPEDWVASVTTVRGQRTIGLSELPDGRLLADAIAADSHAWLGDDHVGAFGVDPNLLVKLLDAGQRLPVHAHPDDAFAKAHVGTAHGKAEAWFVLRPGIVHLGLTDSITADELMGLVDIQDVQALLDRMHAISVQPGDTVFVPPGLLHAIGKGTMVVEVQQPEDLSIVLEWKGFTLDGPRDGHLGLGFELALKAVERSARTPEQIEDLVRRSPVPGAVLVPEAWPFFRLELFEASTFPVLCAGFGVVVVLDGTVTLRSASGDVNAESGSTVLVPAAAGRVSVLGGGRLLYCRPPAPQPQR